MTNHPAIQRTPDTRYAAENAGATAPTLLTRPAASASRTPTSRRRFRTFVGVAAAIMLALGAALVAAGPAQAVTYRDIKSVKYNRCFFAPGDPLEDLYLYACNHTPAAPGNWVATGHGSYNGHPLWTLTNQYKTRCLGVFGTASSNYLNMSCSTGTFADYWEVFTTADGRYVFKSYGAYRRWGQHKCLTFPYSGGTGSVKIGSCSLTNAANKVYK